MCHHVLAKELGSFSFGFDFRVRKKDTRKRLWNVPPKLRKVAKARCMSGSSCMEAIAWSDESNISISLEIPNVGDTKAVVLLQTG